MHLQELRHAILTEKGYLALDYEYRVGAGIIHIAYAKEIDLYDLGSYLHSHDTAIDIVRHIETNKAYWDKLGVYFSGEFPISMQLIPYYT